MFKHPLLLPIKGLCKVLVLTAAASALCCFCPREQGSPAVGAHGDSCNASPC